MALSALLPSIALAYTGVFRASATQDTGSSNPTGIAVGDFDADGAVDVAMSMAGLSGNQLFLFAGLKSCVGGDSDTLRCDGNGDCPGGTCRPNGRLDRFHATLELSSFPSGLLKGKFDSDNLDDLIVARANDRTVVFMKGNGTMDYFDAPGDPFPVGQSPVAMAGADFDNNGTLDLFVANEGGDSAPGSVSVLKGQGDGTFVLQQQPNPDDPEMPLQGAPAELGTRAVAVGQLDSSASLEVLAANRRSNTISLYSVDNTGLMTARGTIPTGPEPSDIALVDINNDTKLDLVVVTSNDDSVTVQLGNGDGTFGTAQKYAVGTAPTRVVVGNMNSDNLLDIVTSNSRSGDVSVLLATSPGVFSPARTFVADAEPQALALADFDHDDLLDVAAATQGGDTGATVAVLLNRDNGTLHGVEDIRSGNGPTAVAVADLDGDGSADLLVSGDSGDLAIFPTRGEGFGEADLLNIGGRTLGLAARDLNGDGLPDIIVADSQNNALAVSLSEGGGHFAAAKKYSTINSPAGVAVGDFNGDGKPDLAATTVGPDRVCVGGPQPGLSCVDERDCAPDGVCRAPGNAAILLQQANGDFGPARNTPVEETPIGIAVVNSNCDNKDDLLVANLAGSSVVVLESNGDGNFTTVQTLGVAQVGTNPIAVAVADFNQDGVDDFAVANTVAPLGSSNVHLFKGQCSGPFAAFGGTGIRVGELANSLVARDFTGDQIVDLAVVSQTSNQVCLLVGVGDGRMTRVGFGSCDEVSRMPIAIAAGDFDSDGRYDAASANNDPSANNVSVLSNCIRDAGCDPFPPDPPPAGQPAVRGDGNGDGIRSAADVVAVAAEIGDGDGVQVEAIARGDFHASPGVDANGDGRVDAQDAAAVAHRIFSGGA
jgi:hypothetical protein